VHVDIRINHLITKAPLYNKNKIKERINQYKKEEFEVLISKKKKKLEEYKNQIIVKPNFSSFFFLFKNE
jgi:bifunctional ADP-heptose synthase (sugar kinase/adenylyltransferase)